MNRLLRIVSFTAVGSILVTTASPAIAGVTGPLIARSHQVRRMANISSGVSTDDVTGSAVYTDTPTSPDLGSNPLRDPVGRGFYSADDLTGLSFLDSVETGQTAALTDPSYDPSQGSDPGDNSFFSSNGSTVLLRERQSPMGAWRTAITEIASLISVLPSVLGSGGNPKSGIGTAFPWEGMDRAGGSSAAPAYLNTATGNLMTIVPIVSWNLPGGGKCGLQLIHNSQDDLDLGWGMNWRSNYDSYIVNLGQNSTTGRPQVAVVYPTGQRIVFTKSAIVGTTNLYTPPPGIYDALTQVGPTLFTLRTKGMTTYVYSSLASAGLRAGPTNSFYAYRLNTVADRFGNRITISNSNGIGTISSSLGTIQLNEYGILAANGSLGYSGYGSITAPGQRTWKLQTTGYLPYGAGVRLDSIHYPTIAGASPVEGFTYNSGMAILSEISKDGSTFSFTYDSSNELKSYTFPAPMIVSGGTILSFGTYKYAYSGSAATKTDPYGYTSTDNYSSGLLRSHVDEAGFSNTYTWDSKYNLTAYSDFRKNTSNFGYDSMGNEIWSQTPLQTAKKLKEQTSYDNYNNVTSTIDCRGAMTTYNLAPNRTGEVLSVVDGLNNTLVTNTYNQFGDIATSTSEGVTTTIQVDSGGRPTTVTTPDRTYEIAYGIGSAALPDVPVSVTDTTMSRTAYPYTDEWGRVTSVARSDGHIASVNLDSMDRVVQATDYLGNSSQFVYDAAGRLSSTTNARGDTTSYRWRDRDTVLTVTDGNSNSKHYNYSPRGEIAGLTLDDGSVETYLYDANGNQKQRTNALSQAIKYTFDLDDRPTNVTYPTGTGVTTSFDDDGRQTSMTDASGTTTWTYDNADRLTQLAQPLGMLTYTYDQWGRRTSVSSSVGKITYGYTGARLTKLTSPQNEVTQYVYDSTSALLSQQINANGTYTNFSYDSLDRLQGITHLTSTGATLTAESYVYDFNGNLTSKTVDGGTTNYQYDAIGQLLSEVGPSVNFTYDYDHNGNRLHKTYGSMTETYSYDAADKLQSRTSAAGTWNYTYDSAGRTTRVTYPSGSTGFTYDYEDRISSVTTSPTGGNATTTGYLYNALDTRVEKLSGTSVLQQYLRDGAGSSDDLLWTNNTTYVPGVSERSGGVTRTLHYDRLGTATAQTNGSGVKTNTFTSDSFGNPGVGGLASGSQSGFAGGWNYQTDTESGLLLLGHRYYDPGSGRFITCDPIGAGSNWYAYSDNNPLTGVDPSGLLVTCRDDPAGWAAEEAADLADETGIQLESDSDPEPQGCLAQLQRLWKILSRGAAAAHAIRSPMSCGRPHHAPSPAPPPVVAAPPAINGETSATAKGKEVHKQWDYGEGYDKRVTLENGKKPDAVNSSKAHVIELKPNNPRAIKRGNKQLEGYLKQLQKEDPRDGGWAGDVITYDPLKPEPWKINP